MNYGVFAFGMISGISLCVTLYALSTWIIRVQEDNALKNNNRAKFYYAQLQGAVYNYKQALGKEKN